MAKGIETRPRDLVDIEAVAGLAVNGNEVEVGPKISRSSGFAGHCLARFDSADINGLSAFLLGGGGRGAEPEFTRVHGPVLPGSS
jgi:hypothetical protein